MWRSAGAAFRACSGFGRQPLRGLSASPSGAQKGVTLSVSPPVGLADEPLHIQVQGLSPGEPVTVRALAVSYYGRLFQSCAHYEADNIGALDLTKDPSQGGDYTGVEPMGLMWSLTPAGMENPYIRMVQRSVLKKPLKLEVTVHQAHNQTGLLLGQVLASARVERWYATPEIRAIRVREGTVRGSFFLPPGDGPFPGVIDMFGDEGGLHEFRASLLACRGFATLALPYFAFEDLPPIMKDLNLDYFAQAAKFVQNHPKVKGPKIGVIGSGKGAELAFSMATFLPDVAAVAKATTIKEALARWEEKSGQKPSEAKEVKLYAQIPPVEKMDASLSMLANCEKLSLSTNCIEKIANLNGLKNLRILSLGRNNIKNLNGLEAVGDTLEELWISYNFIEKLKGIHVMKRLKILYMSNNLVREWGEFVKLAELGCLEELVFVGNPLEEKCSSEGNWIDEATRRVPRLKKLDGVPVIKEDEEEEG
ncbi:dynein light chain 1, axonemal isoform X2 [Sarcophilus harrisii]|uniref:Dynein axonemal light chain 1 n=2 Tax=Sarcophilus harrisii TaxID=9305 RepID=A0A7N4P354_SARHA|nr:dynein light chain 1, axonemal isoform X2 [Sarcophilus harrisii]